MTTATHKTGHDDHRVPLWALFLALLALTAGEVILYDLWVEYQFMPKYALVMVILIFTLPKAAIVMVYFMHLKFEKQLIAVLAIMPFIMACGAVLAILSDTLTLKPRALNQQEKIGLYTPQHAAEHGDDGETDAHAPEH